MGLYGMSHNWRKTLLCKDMCHELDGEFDGRVCHLQLDNQSEHLLLRGVLTTLTNPSTNPNIPEIVQDIGKEEVRVFSPTMIFWTN